MVIPVVYVMARRRKAAGGSKAATKASTKASTKTLTKTPTKASKKTSTRGSTKAMTKTAAKAAAKALTKTPTKLPTKTLSKSPTKPTTKVVTKTPPKVSTRTTRKTNGLPEEKLNGMLMLTAVPDPGSCVSQEDSLESPLCHITVEPCSNAQGPNLDEPDPINQLKPQPIHIPTPVIHKKFGKFRCLLETAESLEIQQNCITVEKLERVVEVANVPEIVDIRTVVPNILPEVADVIVTDVAKLLATAEVTDVTAEVASIVDVTDTTEVADTAEEADTSEVVDTTEIIDTIEMIHTAEVPDTGEITGTSELTKTAEVVEAVAVLETAEEINTPELLNVEKVLSVRDMSNITDVADVTGISNIAESSDVTEMSNITTVTDVGEVAGISEVTDLTEVTDNTATVDIAEVAESGFGVVLEPVVTHLGEMMAQELDMDISESMMENQEVNIAMEEVEEVVWEEEVVEETVVCEGMEIELEDTRSQDDTQMVEEVDSQESDYDQMVEVKDNDYSSQDEQMMVVRENDYAQKMVELTDIPHLSLPETLEHPVLVVKDVEFDNSQVEHEIVSVAVKDIEFDSEDSRGTMRGIEDCSQESRFSVRGVEMEIQEQGKCVPFNVEANVMNIGKGVNVHPETEVMPEEEMEANVFGNQDSEDCSQESQVLLRDVEMESKSNKGLEFYSEDSEIHSKDIKVKSSEYSVPLGVNIQEMSINLGVNYNNQINTLNLGSNALKAINDDVDLIPGVGLIEEQVVLPIARFEDEQRIQEEDLYIGEQQDIEGTINQVTAKIEEEEGETKQLTPNFRSRSGSTDTTGSESGSNSSLGVRRSNRLRSIGILKQRGRSKSEPLDQSASSGERDTVESKTAVVESRDSSDCCSGTDTQSEKEQVTNLKIPVPLSSPATLVSLVTPAIPNYDVDSCKPVKVKSRWRRSSELEMGGNRSSDSELAATPPTPSISPRPVGPTTPNMSPRSSAPAATPLLEQVTLVETLPKKEVPGERKEREDREMEERLRNFVTLIENEYLTDRSTSKDVKRMMCECFLTKEELVRGDMGCGEDCLNRLLMIECGSRCAVSDRCTNKRFQKQDYAKCEIFKTEKKGFGLKTLSDLSTGTFIMEYVGEVLDPKEFRRRAKDYAKDKNRHYYFMALKSDSIIDATMKGNISRFINHSCEPNAETQKWTVNGELRIGFFSKRPISAGEEVTFDYQFQRYGKEAQRCYCEAPLCRGWIGEDPEKEKRDRKERKERELKKKKEEKRRDVKDLLDDMDLEEEIEKLSASGLKNRAHTLTLCRLMVRAEDHESRVQLLKLIQGGEPACRRLFLDYHGLRLIWSWMMDVGCSIVDGELALKTEILQTLAKLPIPNKTMLQDSKVMGMVEKWLSLVSGDSTALALCQEVDKKERHLMDEESGSDQDGGKPRTDAVLPGIETPDEETLQGLESEKQLVDGPASDLPPDGRGSESDDEGEEDRKQVFTELAARLLAEWNTLKEVFRIPKKERIEQMKEHEREADRGYKEYLDKEGHHDKQSYDRHWRQDRFRNDHDKRDRKRARESPDSDRSRKGSRYDDSRILVPLPRMSKQERRQLFALKVAQEEEEERQRRQQQEMWRHHEDQCMALGMDPNLTAAFDPQTGYPCFFDPASGTWQSYPPQDPNTLPPPEMGPSPMFNPNNTHSPHLPGMPPQGVPQHAVPPHGIPPHGMPPHGMPPHGGPTHALLPTPHGMPPHGGPSHGLLPTPHGMPPHGIPPHGVPPHSAPHGVPPHGVPPHGAPPHGVSPHGAPPHGVSPHGAHPHGASPHGTSPHGVPPHNTHPHIAPHGMPPHVMQAPLPPGGYDPNVPHQPIPFDPSNHPVPTIQHHHHQQQQQQQQSYTDPRPAPLDPGLTELIPLPVGPQPLFQQPPAQHVYTPPQQPVEPQAVPQPQYHQARPIQQPFVPPVPPLPPKWKSAKDGEGRVYYYHVKTRISQWEPPQWSQMDQQPESETSSESSDEDEDDEDEDESSSTDEEEEGEQEDKTEEDEEEEEEEDEMGEDKEDLEEDETKDIAMVSMFQPASSDVLMEESELQEAVGPSRTFLEEAKRRDKRREGLVQERIISPRRDEDRQDNKKYKEIKEKLRRKKELTRARERSERSKKRHRDSKQRSGNKSSEKPVTVAADTSSDAARKIKDQFRLQMAGVIVQYLNPYRKPDCKKGRITNTDDFKHLARKLTHFVMLKELKHCRSVDDLECNDNVKHKARDFIKKYMAKFGNVYQRPKDDD